jgi:hypothetical protein
MFIVRITVCDTQKPRPFPTKCTYAFIITITENIDHFPERHKFNKLRCEKMFTARYDLTLISYHACYKHVNNSNTSSGSHRCIRDKQPLGMDTWVWFCDVCNEYKIIFAINFALTALVSIPFTLFNITFEGPKWTRETEIKPQIRITKMLNC